MISLVDCGALIESVDRCWRTPLDIAIEHKHSNVIHILKVFGKYIVPIHVFVGLHDYISTLCIHVQCNEVVQGQHLFIRIL